MADIVQVRKAGHDLSNRVLWVITDRGDDSTLQGPDRIGNHTQSFYTMADAVHAAQWRVEHGLADGVERGPAW